MKIQSQNYSYAYNSESNLVNVSEAQRSEQYFCPICGEQMTPHMGNVRRWHFVHKNIGNCSYESYLHELAKIKIRQAFLSAEHFSLSYQAKAICSQDCPFVGFPKCDGVKPVEFDLKKYYDTCEIEANYEQYRADLLLTSSTNHRFPPVMIEIMVTHKCTDEKIKTDARIIEISIQSEAQIEEIVNQCKLEATRHNAYNYSHFNNSSITLYNFNKIESFNPAESYNEYDDYFSRKDTIVFWLNKEGRFSSFDCHCYEVNKKLPLSVHYFITQIATPFKEIFQEFSKRGVKIRNCFLCRFSKQDSWGDRLCVLYKKHNLPKKPSPSSAVACPHYREDFNSQQYVTEGEEYQSDCKQSYKFYYHICKDIL